MLILWSVMVYNMVWHVVWRFCEGFVVDQLIHSVLWSGCFLFAQASRQDFKKQLLGILGGVKRWTEFLWWNLCNVFNGLCSGTIRVLYLVNLLFLKIIFILISLVLLVEISNSCVSEVATENIYLLFVLLHWSFFMFRAAYLLYKYFFSAY